MKRTSHLRGFTLTELLVVFGLNLLFGLSIPIWVTGLLALTAGAVLVMEHFRVRVDRSCQIPEEIRAVPLFYEWRNPRSKVVL